MCEKYSINLTLPTQEKQNPAQMSKEEESIRMANAERGSSVLPAVLAPRELTREAFQTLGLDPSGH